MLKWYSLKHMKYIKSWKREEKYKIKQYLKIMEMNYDTCSRFLVHYFHSCLFYQIYVYLEYPGCHDESS